MHLIFKLKLNKVKNEVLSSNLHVLNTLKPHMTKDYCVQYSKGKLFHHVRNITVLKLQGHIIDTSQMHLTNWQSQEWSLFYISVI